MESPNPTYLLEHMGDKIRVTVKHAFTEQEKVEFTVIVPSGPATLANLHEAAFGRIRQLIATLP